MTNNIVNKAKAFAMLKHTGQVRKYDGTPYVSHVIRVKEILESFNFESNPTLLVAALLHDTVEDTDTTFQELRTEFDDDVAELVWWLTDDVSLKEKNNRETRKLISAWRISKAPWQAKAIKLADIIDNMQDIGKHDQEFAKTYQKEKEIILEEIWDNTPQRERAMLEDLWFEAKQTTGMKVK